MWCNNDCVNCNDECEAMELAREILTMRENEKRARARRRINTRKHKSCIMKKLTIIHEDGSRFSHFYPACYSTNWKRSGEQTPHIYRYYHSKTKSFLKKRANKKVRHDSSLSNKGNNYKKISPESYWID